jgi:threonyl-tRNA synthetase
MSSSDLSHLRHSAAHLLAAAVKEVWPHAQLTIGPATDEGFYYDVDFGDMSISEHDLSRIENTMRRLIKDWKRFERREVSVHEAQELYKDNLYKLELIEEIAKKGEAITLYTSGNFTDLCRGGHIEHPSESLKHFKLLKVAGAYWRGNEKNAMLTRIYGSAFFTKEELESYLVMREEAEKRDHKKLGRELDLFVFSDLVGSGLPLWTPRGTLMRDILDEFVWSLRKKKGYERVEIPHITKKELYETSGHWEKFKDELFRIKTREGHEFAMKPMNCPHHTQIYARRQWSYREIPQRYANTTICYRDEQSGELSGLSRVRAFSQDDAHVFCRLTQAKEEFLNIWEIIHDFYAAFGFSLRVRVSTHDPEHAEKYLGDKEKWDFAEHMLQEIVTEKKVDWFSGVGEAAFYGPKLDFMAKDALGREWQVATIQLDMNMPERFDLFCINEQGEKERIVMIHAAIMGSIERFFSILIEHTAGKFPLWLAPTQIVLLPIGEAHQAHAQSVAEEMKKQGIRVEVDKDPHRLQAKIRTHTLQKVPFMGIIGDTEVSSNSLSLRTQSGEDRGSMPVASCITFLRQQIDTKVS